MSCERYDEELDDYVDGMPQPEFERHLATCTRCQGVVADFTAIRRASSTLEEHVPPPRLWATIAGSIEEQPRRFPFSMPVALAASLAMLIAAATWFAWMQVPPAPRAPQVAAVSQDTVLPAEAQYDQAIAGLQQVADAQKAQLDPQTRAVFQQNLAAIDRAIDESRAALASEPANTLAQDSLLDALDTKVALLQDAVALGSEDVNQ
jgi:anti-sigma factor RsiW